jgi:ankyrin repeat protein
MGLFLISKLEQKFREAIKSGDIEQAKALFQNGRANFVTSIPASKYGNDHSFLYELIKSGLFDSVKAMIESFGADIHMENEYGFNALLVALWERQPEIANYLKDIGGMTSIRNEVLYSSEGSFLHHCIGSCDGRERLSLPSNEKDNPKLLETVKIVVTDIGVDIHYKDKSNRNALLFALEEAEANVAEYLEEIGGSSSLDASIINVNHSLSRCLRSMKIGQGNLSAVKSLVKYGADIHLKYQWTTREFRVQISPFEIATRRLLIDVLRYLRALGGASKLDEESIHDLLCKCCWISESSDYLVENQLIVLKMLVVEFHANAFRKYQVCFHAHLKHLKFS